jgi:soluble lytic murein transglycosylase-like protein
MMKEAGSFFMIVVGLLALCYCYICSQGGSPFAIAHQSLPIVSAQPSDYHALARQDATNAGISADLFERQIQQESGFNPKALSPAGAEGVAQIMPDTAKAWNVDPWNAPQSLQVASEHMAWYINHYGSYDKALACYNAGCDALVNAMARCNTYWRTCVPAETQRYIIAIMGA